MTRNASSYKQTVAVSTNPVFINFNRLSVEEAELLGATLTVGTRHGYTTLSSRRDDHDLVRATTALSSIDAHDTLVLLKASFSAPKLMPAV